MNSGIRKSIMQFIFYIKSLSCEKLLEKTSSSKCYFCWNKIGKSKYIEREKK